MEDWELEATIKPMASGTAEWPVPSHGHVLFLRLSVR